MGGGARMSHAGYLEATVVFEFRPDVSDEDFEQFLDCVMDEFDKIHREMDLTASLADRAAVFLGLAEAADDLAATEQFLADVRTALHAAGCSTPRWEKVETHLKGVERRKDLIDV